MQERIQIPHQRRASQSRQEQQRVMTEAEVYAAQGHHHVVDQNADEVLDEIDSIVDELESESQVKSLAWAIGELVVAA